MQLNFSAPSFLQTSTPRRPRFSHESVTVEQSVVTMRDNHIPDVLKEWGVGEGASKIHQNDKMETQNVPNFERLFWIGQSCLANGV